MPQQPGYEIDPGRLRHVVQLADATPGTVDDFSQPTTSTPRTYATVRAAIDSLQGRELYQAQQYISNVSHRVTIRYRDGTLAGHRVLFGTRTFIIQAVLNPEERNRRLDLLCLEENI